MSACFQCGKRQATQGALCARCAGKGALSDAATHRRKRTWEMIGGGLLFAAGFVFLLVSMAGGGRRIVVPLGMLGSGAVMMFHGRG